jgi:type I restriction enzyme, R subunit
VNEAETRAEHIDPALHLAGWGVIDGSRILREYRITEGRLQGYGKRSRPDIADYVLVYRNHKLATLEAKRWDLPYSEGMAQAKQYALKLDARFAYASNGQKIYGADVKTGTEGNVDRYPTPDELWNRTFAEENEWRDRFAAVPFEDGGGTWSARYYQDIAVNNVLEALAAGKPRILLTLATGTGKTMIAFQIAWKLFQTRWTLNGDRQRRPRILFLADRNILANQAYNDFAAFAEDALVRISPDDIRKKGKVPKNGNIFFSIFQTFMSGTSTEGRSTSYFGDYPPTFFDFVIIDECHRGGANDESNWAAILEYFSPAVQLGLTATPKRKDNVDTYAYFGEPVYTYSLKEGINDGFLTPFKVRQISTTLDDYVYTSDDTLIEGEVEAGKRYIEADFNRVIEIEEREAFRVKQFMNMIDQNEKTLVFCATQDHALAVRNLINQYKASPDPTYCVRVTANDGALGEQYLRTFQDNEKKIPTILTTSEKLSTGVNARNIRNIVLMRPINSMIEFKQIIGRGTRLYEGKDYFTIFDFVKAHQHFSDAAWDGEPIDETVAPKPPVDPPVSYLPDSAPLHESPEKERKQKIKIVLADGKERQIQSMVATTFWSTDGKPMSAQEFLQSLFGTIPQLFKNEAELRNIWSEPLTRKALVEQLGERGFGKEQLTTMQHFIDADKSDLFDVLAYIAFALPTETREARVAQAQAKIFASCSDKQKAFLDFVLGQYVSEGVDELDTEKLAPLLNLKYSNAISDAIADLGDPGSIRNLFIGFQKHLYEARPAFSEKHQSTFE